MYTVVSKQQFSEKVFKLEITAPLIARSRKAGHFVIVRLGEKGERVPLTIAGADTDKGTITLVIQKVGHASSQICDTTPSAAARTGASSAVVISTPRWMR